MPEFNKIRKTGDWFKNLRLFYVYKLRIKKVITNKSHKSSEADGKTDQNSAHKEENRACC